MDADEDEPLTELDEYLPDHPTLESYFGPLCSCGGALRTICDKCQAKGAAQ